MQQKGQGNKQEIYCAVSNCHYYQTGHKCSAEKNNGVLRPSGSQNA